MDQNEFPLDPHHVGGPSVRLKLFPKLWYVRQKRALILHRD
jgi:hypothetical protein